LRLASAVLIASLTACGADPAREPPGGRGAGERGITSGSLALGLATTARCQGLDPCSRTPDGVVLWLALLDGGRTLRVSSPADVVELPVEAGHAPIAAPLPVISDELGEASLDSLDLEVVDSDGDGVMDGARASGLGHFAFLPAPCGASAGHGTFTAEASTAAVFQSPGVAVDDDVWPATGIPVRSAGSALRITSAQATVGADAFELAAPSSAGVQLSLPPAALPFGASGVLALDVEDITDSAHGRTAPFTTVALAPGELDGTFEGGALGGIASRGVLVVDRYLVPGSGARIAYARDGVLSFPVDVPAGGGALRFSARALNQPGAIVVRSVGPGGFREESHMLQVTEDVPDVPALFAPGMLQAVSPQLDLAIDLSAHAGGRAVVEIRLQGPPVCELQDEFAGFAIDDLSLP
jgi:hypothetical protein